MIYEKTELHPDYDGRGQKKILNNSTNDLNVGEIDVLNMI